MSFHAKPHELMNSGASAKAHEFAGFTFGERAQQISFTRLFSTSPTGWRAARRIWEYSKDWRWHLRIASLRRARLSDLCSTQWPTSRLADIRG